MPFWDKNLIHTITYARPSTTPDANGDPASIGNKVRDVPARVQGINEVVIGPDLKEVLASHMIETSTEIRPGDQIWCPSLGDDDTNAAHARHPLRIKTSDRLHGFGTKYVVYL